MTLSTGSKRRSVETFRLQCAFTLVELILVMALLVIVLAVGAPTLAGFFSGRTINSEAKRLMALTRYAQSQAVSRGVPMELWLDRQDGSYGLRVQEGYDFSYGNLKQPAESGRQAVPDEKNPEFQLGKDLEFELQDSGQGTGLVDRIRFAPDGSIDDDSPSEVVIRQSDQEWVRVRLSDDRLNYEIDENKDVR